MPRLPLALLAALALWGSASFFTGGGASQQAHYGTARALVAHGTFTLDPYPFIDVDVARYGGHKLSNKPPGFPLLLAPAALVGMAAEHAWPGKPGTARQVGAHLTQLLGLGVMGVMVTWALAAALALYVGARRAAYLAGLGYAGTFLLPFSTTFFSHMATAVLAAVVAWLLARAHAATRPLTTLEAAAVGFLLGYGPVVEYSVTLAFLPVGVWALARARSWPERAALAAGAALPVAMLVAYQAHYFGGPLDFSYAHLSTDHQVTGHASGFLGASWPRWAEFRELTFGTYRGLFLDAPLTLLGALGLMAWVARRDAPAALAAILLTATLATLLFISGYWAWQGGSSFGPRFLVPVIPWLLLGLAFVDPRWPRLVAAAGGLGAAFMVLGPAVCMIPHASHVPGYYNLVTFLGAKLWNGQVPAYAEPLFDEGTLPAADRPGSYAYNLGHLVGLRGAWSVLPYLVVTAGLLVALWAQSRRRDGSR